MTEQDAIAIALAFTAEKNVRHADIVQALFVSRHRYSPDSGAKDHWSVYFAVPSRDDESDRPVQPDDDEPQLVVTVDPETRRAAVVSFL